MNEIKIAISAQDTGLASEFDDMGSAVRGFGQQTQRTMADTEEAFDTAARNASTFGAALDKAAGFGDNMSAGLQGVSDVTGSLGEAMNYSERAAIELAQAQQDVEQASQDAAQATQDLRQAHRDAAQAQLDSTQAAVDVEQALLDQRAATEDYAKAVKEHGKNSIEAKQAQIDLKQSGVDLKQAQEDARQATEDLSQAHLDASQAELDHAQANKDLTAAQHELEQQSSTLNKVSEWSGMLSGVLGGLVGIIGAVTAVQWAWNASLLANPIVLIIVAILALVAAIVVIAVKTTWFQDLWNAIWGAIGDPVKATLDFIVSYFTKVYSIFTSVVKGWWNFFTTAWKTAANFAVKAFRVVLDIPSKLGSAFSKVGQIMYAPFKWAFNMIAKGWNNTIGRLNWSVPGWVPGIGGNSISVPNIPMLQRGGEITQTGLALVHKGERVLPAGTRALNNSNGGTIGITVSAAPGAEREFVEWMITKLSFAISRYGQGEASYIGIRTGP